VIIATSIRDKLETMMMVMAEPPSRPTTTTTTASSAEALLGEFRLLGENGKEEVEENAVSAAPVNDAFYQGMLDVERDFDFGLLYKNYVSVRTVMICIFSFQLYQLNEQNYVELYHRGDD
jgi:hypothetical protein